MQIKQVVLACLGLMLLIEPGQAAQSSPQAAAVIDDGYAGKILRKIVKTGKLRVGSSLELRLSLDDHGHLLECRATNQAEAEEACAAAKAAAPFGTPPYGMPTFVTIALWSQQGAAKGKNAAVKPAKTDAGTAAKSGDDAYIRKIRRDLRNSMYIPAETKPGTYHVTVLLHVDSRGQILDSSIVKGSGDQRLDKYCLQGIKRAGKIAPPPAGMGENIELTFALTR